jgi:drug/metabolite transporter (DMT)-like permease
MLCYKKTNIAGENMGSTRKGMLNVLIAAVLWGSSGVCAQYIMEKSHISSPYLTMVRLLFTGVILLTLSFVHGDKIFSVIKHRKDALSLLFSRWLARSPCSSPSC